jgi:hypothetical protein
MRTIAAVTPESMEQAELRLAAREIRRWRRRMAELLDQMYTGPGGRYTQEELAQLAGMTQANMSGLIRTRGTILADAPEHAA